MSQRTEIFQSLRTQQLRYQNPNNTYPATGAVMAVTDIRGTVEPILDPVVRSMGLVGMSGEVGELTYENGVLYVNRVPVGGGGGGGPMGPTGPAGVGPTGPAGVGLMGPVGPTGPGGGGSLRFNADAGQVLYYNGSEPVGATGLYYTESVVQPRTHIVPNTAETHDLGSEEKPFRDVHAGVSLRLGRLHLTASGDYVHVKGANREYDIIPGSLSRTTKLRSRAVVAASPQTVAGGRNPQGTPTRKTVNIVLPSKGTYIVIYHAQITFTGVRPARDAYLRITPDGDLAKQQQYSNVVEGHTHTYPVMFTVTNKSSTTITFEYPHGKMDVVGRFECIKV